MQKSCPFLLSVALFLCAARAICAQDPCPGGKPVPPQFRIPDPLPPGEPVEFEKKLLQYLQTYDYQKLGWCSDKSVRDTGPLINLVYYGTHPAVRIYYSPEVMQWLRNGRKGSIPDGAVILKEHHAPPAERYLESGAASQPTDWTFMIRKASGSRDGWFWGEVYAGMSFENTALQYPNAGFGIYCVRCHASAESQSTFSSLNNIIGFPGNPVTFRIDDSWRTPAPGVSGPAAAPAPQAATAFLSNHIRQRLLPPGLPQQPAIPFSIPSNAFTRMLKFFGKPGGTVQTFPPQPLDHIVPGPDGLTAKAPFVTSDQCQSCHSAAAAGASGPSMFLGPGPKGVNAFVTSSGSLQTVQSQPSGINVSPYGEWRWSPMGLAGRDPIFFAQLESEFALIDSSTTDKKVAAELKQQAVNICLTCHGAMGKRQFDIDNPKDPNFNPAVVFDPKSRYGGLARDGISCTVCHHIADSGNSLEEFLNKNINGQFTMGKPSELYGPFRDVAELPMENSIGAKPVYNSYTKSSRLCGSCHTINLPIIDVPPVQPVNAKTRYSVEQNTYLEWLNSAFQNEYAPAQASARSCQDCHMSSGYANAVSDAATPRIATRIASIQDGTYPQVENLADLEKLRVPFRTSGYRRHELVGINVFLLQMFNQMSWIMGLRTSDYMSGSLTDLPAAMDNMIQQAQQRTARLAVRTSIAGSQLIADVVVENQAGHRFPSGVGFRRAFLELLVLDQKGTVVWGSGRTDSTGVILGKDGKPLRTEFFAPGPDAKPSYQPHFSMANPLRSEDQVQIYEELVQDHAGNMTTSFLRRDHDLKDNRILPKGWTKQGPDVKMPQHFLEATWPVGQALSDPAYLSGSGTSRLRYEIPVPAGGDPGTMQVQATLYYQSIPPYYLEQRFRIGGNGPATRRLYYLTSRLALEGTPLAGWKLKIASASAGPLE